MPHEGCLLVDVVDVCLPILLDSMFFLAPFSCLLPDAAPDPVLCDPFGLRGSDQARTRHPTQLHPRPVAAPAFQYRASAH